MSSYNTDSLIGDCSWIRQHIQQNVQIQTNAAMLDEEAATERRNLAREMLRPFHVLKPRVMQDGNAWLAILGDLPTGVVGSGDTPELAAADFDRAWRANK